MRVKTKNKSQVIITILHSIPGSVKTFFINVMDDRIIVDFDSIVKSVGSNKSAIVVELCSQIVKFILINEYQPYSIVIDKMIMSKRQLRNIIKYIAAHLTQYQLVFKILSPGCLLTKSDVEGMIKRMGDHT